MVRRRFRKIFKKIEDSFQLEWFICFDTFDEFQLMIFIYELAKMYHYNYIQADKVLVIAFCNNLIAYVIYLSSQIMLAQFCSFLIN